MPAAFYVSSALTDLTVDVQLASVAQGDVLYHSATKWQNLAAGTSGQFLQTAGAGANPVWATVPVPDFSTVPLLAPNSVNRNLIVPTADANKGLVLRAHSATPSAPLLEWQTAAGGVLGQIGADGLVGIGSPAQSQQSLSVANFGRFDTIFSCQASAANFVGAYVTCTDFNANPIYIVTSSAGLGLPVFFAQANNAADIPFQVNGKTAQTGDLFLISADDNTYVNSSVDSLVAVDAGGNFRFSRRSSIAANFRQTARLDSGYLDNTDATRKGRLTLSAVDFAGTREGLRIEASGSAPMIGFLGHAAQAQQTLPANATDLATALTLLNAVKSQICQGFGFAS